MRRNLFKVGLNLMFKYIFLFSALSLTLLSFPVTQEDEVLSEALSIDECIEIALRNSPLILVAEGSVKKSELDVRDAKANFLPEVDLSGGYYIDKTYNTFEWNQDHYDLNLSASMQPFSSGKTYLDIERTNANLNSAREGYKLTKMDLVMEVISRYYNLIKASQMLELRVSTLEQKEYQLEFSRAQFELGMVPRADTLKARAAFEGARVDLHETDGEYLIRKAELNEIMGLDLDSSISVKEVELKNLDVPGFDSVLTVAYENRPDIKQQDDSLDE
jgi:outer membrane protein